MKAIGILAIIGLAVVAMPTLSTAQSGATTKAAPADSARAEPDLMESDGIPKSAWS
jgi:hypothetical protein